MVTSGDNSREWAVELTASDWSHVLQLTAGDVSRGGLFVRSSHGPAVGAEIGILLRLPDGSSLDAEGRVVHRLDRQRAEALGTEEGFGVRFAEKHASDLWLLEAMASSHARGPIVHGDDRYVTFAAVLIGRVDGTRQMTAAHRPLRDVEDQKPAPRLDLSSFAEGAGQAIEVEIDLDDLDDPSSPGAPAAALPLAAPSSPRTASSNSATGQHLSLGDHPAAPASQQIVLDLVGDGGGASGGGGVFGTASAGSETLDLESEVPLDSLSATPSHALPATGFSMPSASLDADPPGASGRLADSDGAAGADDADLGADSADSSDVRGEAERAAQMAREAEQASREAAAKAAEAAARAQAARAEQMARAAEAAGPGAADEPRSDDATADILTLDKNERQRRRPTGVNALLSAAEDDDAEPGKPRLALSGSGHIFGIDFGTSYASIAVVHDDEVTILPDSEGQTLTPSVVTYPNRGRPVVGWQARLKQAINRSSTFTSPKRLLGRSFDQPEVQPLIAQSGIGFSRGPQDTLVANVWGQPISMPQVAAEVLRSLADVGESITGVRVEEVVLAAPVAFADRQRDALRRAARLAGLRLIAILDEPFAAAIAYGMTGSHDETVAVYDFGGGTFDFTLARITDRKFRVLERTGDAWLGGDDFDLALAEYVAAIFERDNQIDLRKRQVEWQQVVLLCERAKRKLSTQKQALVTAKRLAVTRKGALGLDVSLDRQLLSDICGGLVDRSLALVEQCMTRAGVQPKEVDEVVLTGGVSRIPMVRDKLQKYFGRPMNLIVSPDHAIVAGTALYGSYVRASRQVDE